jgi:hypothetical protein
MRNFTICTAHQIFFGRSNKKEMGEACSAYGERRINARFWWEPEGKRPARRTRRRWKYNIKMDL